MHGKSFAVAVAFLAVAASLSSQTFLISGKRPARMTESVGPQVTSLAVPPFPGAHALWGSTGQDSRGHIWFGVTAEGNSVPSAHLFEYDP